MLLGTEVSAGWVDKAAARVSAQLGKAGFDEAMLAALAAEDVLAADETPVNVLDGARPAGRGTGRGRGSGPGGEGRQGRGRGAARADHPDPGRAADVPAGHRLAAQGHVAGGLPASFTGYLITDGYTGYQHLLSRLAGIQQCAPARHPPVPGGHETRPRRRAELGRRRHHDPRATRTGPSRPPAPAGTPPWTSRSSMTCGNATTPPPPSGSSTTGCGTGTTGNHPGYALGCWLRDYKEQVFLFTRDFAVSWTNDRASYCTSWGCCAVSGWGGRLGWLADVILAWGGDIFGGSRAAGDAVGVAAA